MLVPMTERIEIHQVDAFTARLFAGNPAAVCPLQRWLDDSVMQAIAAENNLSETAFLVREGSVWRLRWFTPTTEVDLCGHATLASAWVVLHRLAPELDEVAFETRSGTLLVKRDGPHLVMDLPAAPPRPCDPSPGMIEALGGGTPQEVLRAGMFLVVYENEAQVRELDPDMRGLMTLERDGVVVTAPGDEVDFVSRYFVPAAGIDEDPVTGSAHAMLMPYWSERLGKTELRARQISARGGEVGCRMGEGGDRVLLTGQCVPYMRGVIELG
jgi:PhzF family phenazine biosynthesis protein